MKDRSADSKSGSGEPLLGGCSVLVAESHYFLAMDVARALQQSGAKVLGPWPTEDKARSQLRASRPDAAVFDVDLGAGVSFELAEALTELGVPFVFVTACGPEAIPARYAGAPRIEKPAPTALVVAAVARLLAGRP